MQIRACKPKRYHLNPYILKMLSFVCHEQSLSVSNTFSYIFCAWFWSKFVHGIWVCRLAALAPLSTLWSPASDLKWAANWLFFLQTDVPGLWPAPLPSKVQYSTLAPTLSIHPALHLLHHETPPPCVPCTIYQFPSGFNTLQVYLQKDCGILLFSPQTATICF